MSSSPGSVYSSSKKSSLSSSSSEAPTSSSSSVPAPQSSKPETTQNVTIKFNETVSASEASEEDIKKAIVDLVGGGVTIADVQVIVDENGRVTGAVVVVVGSEDDAQTVATIINELDKGSSCDFGVLCRVENAFVGLMSTSAAAGRGCAWPSAAAATLAAALLMVRAA